MSVQFGQALTRKPGLSLTRKPTLSWTRKPGLLRAPKPPVGIAAALAACALCMLAVGRRDIVVRAAPQTAGLFAAIGLPVNLRGLEFRGVSSRLLDDESGRVLAVEGDVANLRHAGRKLPDVLVTLRGPDGRTVYAWTSPAPQKNIGPGESVHFRARLAAPPSDGVDVKLRFIDAAKK